MKENRAFVSARRLFRPLLAFALCAGAAGARAQTAQTPEQDEVVAVKSNLVNVDVMVRGKDGKYATDLKAEDFNVYENGTPQTVVFFDPPPAAGSEGRAPASAAANAPGGRAGRARNFISLVLDAQTTDASSMKQVRDGIIKYIRERVGEGDTVALFAVSGSLQLLHPFTHDKARLIAAVEQSYAQATAAKNAEAAGLSDGVAQLRERSAALSGVEATPGPALAEKMIIDRTIQQFLVLRAALSLQQSRPLLAALAAICEGQRAVPGKKTLVLFSQGFVSPAVLDWQVRSTIDLANRANVAIYVIDSAGLRASAPASGALVPQSPLGGISGLVSQEERIRGSGGENVFDRARSEGINREYDILYRISEESGGKFFKGSNDIAGGLERVDEELRARYTIGYQSTDPNLDGGFRKVRVEVRRPGAAVVTRAGYYAIPPGDVSPLSPDDRKLLAGFAAAEASPGLPLAVELVPFRSRGGLYVIPVSLEVPPGALRFERRGDRQRMQLDVLGVVRDGQEKVLSRLGGNFDVNLTAAQYEAIMGDQVFYRQDLELAPGEYTLELIVRDRLSGKVAARRERLVLPELGTEFAASGVVLGRRAEPARHPAAGPDVLREGDAQIRPTPRREFNAADNLIIFFKLYNAAHDPATGRPQVRVTLILTRDGKAAAKPVGYDLTEAAAAPLPHLSFARFVPLKGLPPGAYEAVVEARDMVTLKLLKQRAAFVIKP
jgi:VWFA-related protein